MTTHPEPTVTTFSFSEVANHLNVDPATLRALNERFARFVVSDLSGESPRYSSADIAALVTVQKLLEQGFSDAEVAQFLTPKRMDVVKADSIPASGDTTALLPQVVGDVISAIANTQQTVLNSQSAVREMVGVVVQDNFNLKDENRKLRDRMLELERSLAEYQRREETRKERLESRIRALENVVTALQQQVAQLVQIQRQRRRGWFG